MEYADEQMNNEIPTILELSAEKFRGYLTWVLAAVVLAGFGSATVSFIHWLDKETLLSFSVMAGIIAGAMILGYAIYHGILFIAKSVDKLRIPTGRIPR